MAIYEILFIYRNEKDEFATDRHLLATTGDTESHKEEAHYQLDEMFKEFLKWKKNKK